MAPGEVRLFAYFVALGELPVSQRMLREHLAKSLPDYMMPSAFVAKDAIPQSPNGKTDRLRLPLPVQERGDPESPLNGPRNPIEAELLAIWKNILGTNQLGIDDDFLSLGGDSLQAARIAAHMSSRYDLNVPAVAPMQLGTVAAMTEALVAAARAPSGSVAVRRAWRSADRSAPNSDGGSAQGRCAMRPASEGRCCSTRVMRHRLARRGPGRRLRLQPQVLEDLLDHRPLQDGCDDVELPGAAVRAVLPTRPSP